ncbi:MAG: hypothetical protein JXA01_09920 [Dehalococcoidia bacterium]|nr:hypothetical protein [Dehalococcoidia bacterium]
MDINNFKFLIIAAIVIFSAMLLLTAFNVIFQTGPDNENTTNFPNPVMKSLGLDIFSRYALIAFCAIALCFLIMGLTRKK